MTVTPNCNICGSDDFQYNEQRKYWTCKKCGYVWVPKIAEENPAPKKKKIFLSYGHDEYTPNALRIKKDLEERGHEVWFDQKIIKEGRDWELYIENGLKWSNLVVLLMTPHSVRRQKFGDPKSTYGYCLNEIAKALEKNKLIIPILLVWLDDGVPLSICRIQYLDLHDLIPIQEHEEKYQDNFNRLLKAIEEDDLDFEGGQARLQHLLKPLNFDQEIRNHIIRFKGREWLFSEIDRWLEKQPESRIFWLCGGPGIGKTAISTNLLSRYSNVVASHFCVAGHAEKSNSRRAILSIAFQLARHLKLYELRLQNLNLEKEVLNDAQTLFDNLIVQPLSRDFDTQGNQYLVIIDAIDEATHDGRNEIAQFINDQWGKTPSWLKLFITSRGESDILATMTHLEPYVFDAKSNDNVKDLRKFLVAELSKRNLPTSDITIDEIVQKSEGIFLYIILFLDELDKGRLNLNEIRTFPIGIGGIFKRFFERKFPDISSYSLEIKPVLECICAQREPLDLAFLADALQIPLTEMRQRLARLGTLFPIRKSEINDKEIETISPFHKSLTDWLVEIDPRTGFPIADIYSVDKNKGESRIADHCWGEYEKGLGTISQYSFQYLPYHLLAIKRYKDLVPLITNKEYFISSWAHDQFQVKSWWAAIEESSDIRIPDVFKNVIAFPLKYSRGYLSAVAKLLADTGYVQKSESIHAYLNVYFFLMSDKRNRQIALGNLGYISLLKGKFSDALRLFKKQERICRNLSDIEGLITVLGNKGTAFYKLDMLDIASECYKEQEELCIQVQDIPHLQMCIGNQGNVFFDSEQFDEAMDFYKKQFALCEGSGNLQGQSQSIGNQGNVLFRLTRYDEALEYYKKCEQICKKILYKEGLQRALGDQGKIYLVKRDFSTALDLFNQQEILCKTIGSSRSLGECLRFKGKLFEEEIQLEKAGEIYREMMNLYRDIGDDYGLSDAIGCMGFINIKRGDLHSALNNFIECERLSRLQKNSKKIVEAIINQGLVYEVFGDFERAIKYYQNAENICRSHSNTINEQFRFGLQYALNNKADIFTRTGDIEKSLAEYQLQEEICRKTSNFIGLQYSLSSQAAVYRDFGEYEKAIQQYRKYEKISNKTFKFLDFQRALGLIGNIFIRKGDFTSAKKQYIKQLEVCLNNGFYHESLSSLLHLLFTLDLLDEREAGFEFKKHFFERKITCYPAAHVANNIWNQGIAFSLERDLDPILDFINLSQDLLSTSCTRNLENLQLTYTTENCDLIDELNAAYMKSEEIFRKIGFLIGLQHISGMRGMLFSIKGDFDSALSRYKEQNAICKKIGYCKGQEISAGRLAKCYLSLGMTDDALLNTEAQNKLCIEKGYYEGKIESEFLMMKIQIRKKNFSDARRLLKICEENCILNKDSFGLFSVLVYKKIIHWLEYQKDYIEFGHTENEQEILNNTVYQRMLK